MTSDEIEKIINEKGQPTAGFGFSGYAFEKEQLELDFIYHGLFADKVTSITTSNPSHSIYGIHIGDTYKSAVYKLNINGFKEESYGSNRFFKKFMYAILSHKDNKSNVGKVTIGINSWTPFKRTY